LAQAGMERAFGLDGAPISELRTWPILSSR